MRSANSSGDGAQLPQRKGPLMHRPKTPSVTGLALLALVVVLAAGCGGSSKKASSTTTTATTGTTATTISTPATDSKISAEVPAKLKSKTLIVAADATYAPNEFIGSNGKTVEGMDPDLAKALAAGMGVKVKVVNTTFDGIIPGLAAGKFDVGMSSFTDTKERQKTVDFVTYFQAGTSFYVKASGGPTINSLADLCGHSVGVERGTTQADDATAQNGKCKKAGKPGVKVAVFPDQNGANLALASGRGQGGMADSPAGA